MELILQLLTILLTLSLLLLGLVQALTALLSILSIHKIIQIDNTLFTMANRQFSLNIGLQLEFGQKLEILNIVANLHKIKVLQQTCFTFKL